MDERNKQPERRLNLLEIADALGTTAGAIRSLIRSGDLILPGGQRHELALVPMTPAVLAAAHGLKERNPQKFPRRRRPVGDSFYDILDIPSPYSGHVPPNPEHGANTGSEEHASANLERTP